MVSLAWPWALTALPLPLLLAWATHPRRAEHGIRPPPLLAEALCEVAGETSTGGGRWRMLAWIAWSLLLLAIAQPALMAGEALRPASGRAIVVAIDLSSSMERTDFELDGRPVDRLTAFKSVAGHFVDGRVGDRIGLVFFGEAAFSAAPVGYDLSAMSNTIREAGIGMAGRTTAIGEAIGLATIMLRDDPASESAIVLMSDGTNNAGSVEPEDAARLARDFGIRVHAVGMASTRAEAPGSPLDPSADLDEETLRIVAETSGGRFFRARTTGELAAIYAEIDRLERTEAAAPPVVPMIDLRNFALAGLALVLGALALSRRR
jgi:Ca-activated chloride channel homolog